MSNTYEYPDDPGVLVRTTLKNHHRALLLDNCRPVESGCWEWLGYGTDRNRPKIKLGRHLLIAARASYMLFVGPISSSRLLVCHTCDNPICVNPAHLFLGTALDNVTDMIRKGRDNFDGRRTRLQGTYNGRSVLTPESVAQIKRRLLDGEKKVSVAKTFNVSISTISAIANDERWRDVVAAPAPSPSHNGEGE